MIVKYAMNWSFTDQKTNTTKTGCSFYALIDGIEHKIDAALYDSLDCPNIGFKHMFVDNNKQKTNIWFTKEEN